MKKETLKAIKVLNTDRVVLAILGEIDGEIVNKPLSDFNIAISEEDFVADISIDEFKTIRSFAGGFATLPLVLK